MAPAQGWHAQIEKWSKFFWDFFPYLVFFAAVQTLLLGFCFSAFPFLFDFEFRVLFSLQCRWCSWRRDSYFNQVLGFCFLIFFWLFSPVQILLGFCFLHFVFLFSLILSFFQCRWCSWRGDSYFNQVLCMVKSLFWFGYSIIVMCLRKHSFQFSLCIVKSLFWFGSPYRSPFQKTSNSPYIYNIIAFSFILIWLCIEFMW